MMYLRVSLLLTLVFSGVISVRVEHFPRHFSLRCMPWLSSFRLRGLYAGFSDLLEGSEEFFVSLMHVWKTISSYSFR